MYRKEFDPMQTIALTIVCFLITAATIIIVVWIAATHGAFH